MGSPVHPGCYRCGGECVGHAITNPIANPAPIEHEPVMDADEENRPVHVDAGPSRAATSKRVLLPRGPRVTECPCGCTYVTAVYGTCPGDNHNAMILDALRTLAANLATAGALCEAFDAGCRDLRWRPGCGRSMPGWGGGE